MSASALNRTAGARTRLAPLVAGLVMAIVVVAFGGIVDDVAMPTLAGLLILVGVRTIDPGALVMVWRTGTVQKLVLAATFLLTLVIPLQYAVMVGVAFSLLLHAVRQSNQVTVKRRVFERQRRRDRVRSAERAARR